MDSSTTNFTMMNNDDDDNDGDDPMCSNLEQNEDMLQTTQTTKPAANVRKMFCIDGPVPVENLDRFLKCCGGLSTIQRVYQTPKERLQFRFRPDDPNSIPLFSMREASSDLAVKVRKLKKSDGTFQYRFETMGIIDTTFHFEDKLCDMQLLPTQSDIRNELLKSDFIISCDANFSLADDHSHTMMKNYFHSRFFQPKSMFSELSEQTRRAINRDRICQLRKSRRMFGVFAKWDDTNIPKTLPEVFKIRIPEATYQDPVAIQLKQLFDQRPMWSRLALLSITRCKYTKLKFLLPMFAFCYLTGPFRFLWVRYGYNPKLDKSSKVYQSIDCRYRASNQETFHNKVTMFKDHSVSHKPNVSSPFNYMDESQSITVEGDTTDGKISGTNEELTEDDYIFRPGKVSIFKRSIYQLCDIELKEAQEIIHENDNQETECTEKDGWCSKGSMDRIRKLMLNVVNKMLEDPEIAKKVEKNNFNLDTEDHDIEVSEVYDHFYYDEDESGFFKSEP